MARKQIEVAGLQTPENGQILVYQGKDGKTKVEVNLQDETVWLTQAHMSDLFEKNKRTISEHIRNLFKEGELREEAVVRKSRTTAADQKTYSVKASCGSFTRLVVYSAVKRMTVCRALWPISSRPMTSNSCTPVLRRRLPVCFTSWFETTPLWTVISVSQRSCSYGFSR
jgi:hypothetical protein